MEKNKKITPPMKKTKKAYLWKKKKKK